MIVWTLFVKKIQEKKKKKKKGNISFSLWFVIDRVRKFLIQFLIMNIAQ
jgi:hypothetical protein